MAYDAAGRTTSISYSGDGGVTPNETMTYYADGKVATTVSSTLGTMTDSYDHDRRLISRIEPPGISSPATITYDYYGDGTRQDINVSSSALTETPLMTYSYRADGLRQTLKAQAPSGTTTYGWLETPGGRYTSQTVNGTTTTVQSYDSTGRATSKTPAIASIYPLSAATYDFQDNLSSVTIGTSGSVTDTFTYDATNELKSTTPSTNFSTYCSPENCATISRFYTLGALSNTTTSVNTGASATTSYSLQTPDPRTGGIENQTNSSVSTPATPNPPCGGPAQDGRRYTYDAAGREASGSWGWSYTFINPHDDCTYYTGTGSMSQTFDTNNHVISHTETTWNYRSIATTSYPMTWTSQWGPDGHIASITNSFPGQATDKATLHWDGDNLLFENDQSAGLLVFADGALGGACDGAGDFDFAGYAKSSEGYALNLNSFQNRGTSDPSYNYPNAWSEIFCYSAPGTITDGINTFQGVRQTDNMTNQWMTPDAYAGRVEDPMSQRPYMWNNNNPVTYSDPSGYNPLVIVAGGAIVEIGAGEALAAIGAGALGAAISGNGSKILGAIGDLVGITPYHASGQVPEPSPGTAPNRPTTIVGTPPNNPDGGRINSGPLDPQHGGTGDAGEDFNKLTGGKSRVAGQNDPAKPGSAIGPNGISLRGSKDGPRIDIPASGDRPHETLHYPK